MNTFLALKGINQQLTNPLINGIKDFYIEDVKKLISFKRKGIFGIIIFAFKELILLQLQLDNDSYKYLISQDSYFFFIKDSKYSNDTNVQDNLVLFFTIINAFILVYFLTLSILRSRIKIGSFYWISMILCTYEYLFALPSLYISLINYSYLFSLINIGFTFVLGSFILSQDYGYEYKSQDILQKIDSSWNILQFHLDFILCIGSCFFDVYVMIAFSLIINSIKLIFLLKNHTYVNRNICRWVIILTVFRINQVFNLIILAGLKNCDQLVFLIGIILFPISYKLGDMIFTNWYEFINLESIPSSASSISNSSFFTNIVQEDIIKIDTYCRLLVDKRNETLKVVSPIENQTFVFSSEISSASQKQQQQLKDAQLTHKTNKKSKSKITEQEDKNHETKESQVSHEKLLLQETFNSEALDNIINLYKTSLSKKKYKNTITNLHFSYLTLLATLSLNSCFTYFEILNFKVNEKLVLGWKDQQKMATVMSLADSLSKINQQRQKKQQNFELYLILQFEEEMSHLQQTYYECLRLYKISVEKLSMSFIDLNEAQSVLQDYRKLRNNLEGRILKQLQVNSHSEQLRNLCINFDFYMLHKSNLFKFYEKQNRLFIHQLNNKEYYSKLSCFLYVSLLQKNFGEIKRVNRSFIKAFGFSNRQQITGKSITQIMPNNFLKYNSDDILSSIITEDLLLNYNETFFIPLFIAKNLQGYALPVQLKIQSQIVDNTNFGLTIWVKPILNESLYLVIDQQDHSQIKIASKLFLEEFLYDSFNISHLRNIRMDCFIPIIDVLIKLNINDPTRKFDTILIKPQDKFEAQTKPNLENPNFLNQLRDLEIFFVSISFSSHDMKIASFTNVIIDYYEPIYNLKDKIQYIQSYQAQLQEFCGINLEFDPNYCNEGLSDMRVKNYQDYNQSNTVKIQNVVQFHFKNNTLLTDSVLQVNNNNNNNNNNNQMNYQVSLKPESAKLIVNQDSQMRESNQNFSKTYTIHDNQQNQKVESIIQLEHQNNENKIISSNINLNVMNMTNAEESQIYNQISNQQTIEDNQEQFNNINSKEVSNNNLLSTKQGFLFSTFMSRKNSNMNIQMNTTKSQQQQQKERECQTGNESKFPVTQEESKRRGKVDQSSVASSSKSTLNKQLIEMIHTKKQMTYIRVINMMGLFSILVTLSLTFSGFYVFITSLVSQRENFKYINWMYQINLQISYAFSEYYVGLQNTNGWYKTSAAQFDEFNKLVQQENGSRINGSKDTMVLLYNNTNPEIEVFNIIKDIQIQQKLFQSKTKYDEQDFSLMYSILLQIVSIFHFVGKQDPTNLYRYQAEMNYPELNSQVEKVISQLNATYQGQLDNIQQQILLQLFVVLAVTFTFLMSIIPSYIYTKMRQQKILELLATFDPASLKEILGQLTYQIGNYSFYDKNQTIASKSNLTMTQTHVSRQAQAIVNIEKKLNISRTSPLIYSIKYLTLGLLIIFSLIMIYPITNFVIVKQFIDNSTIIYDFNSKQFSFSILYFQKNNIFLIFNNCVSQTQFSIVNILRARQGVAIGFLMPEIASQPLSHYQNLFESLNPLVDSLIDKTQENLSKLKQSNIYNMQIFEDFLLSAYEKNTCYTMGNFTQYLNNNFLLDQCLTSGRQNLQKGLLNGLQFFYSLFKESYRFMYSFDQAAFLVNYNIFNKSVTGINQFKFKIELNKMHEYLLNFFQDQNAKLYDHYYYISIILVIYQISFVIILFTLSWGYYFRKINSIIYNAKELLDVFPQQVLIQNTYIMSFLRQNE